ncbi:hypothetical protein RI367_002542 [Sorochytrium milnesiophthora]
MVIMEPESFLRINSSLMSQFTNKFVAVPGRVVSVEQAAVTLETSDKGQITVHLNQRLPHQTPNFTSKFVEVLGTVKPDGTLNMISFSCWDDSVDLDNIDQMIRRQFNHLDLYQE